MKLCWIYVNSEKHLLHCYEKESLFQVISSVLLR